MPLVSVVVATYSPGAGLDRLVASLDRQTLPADRFEVIFVDDGSPDDTVERLHRIASTRPNIRVEAIENSGWASRPRNVGLDLAEGEYVLFMDHDDELYPDALRAGAEFARRHGADVLNGKEARTQDAGWALDTYRADSPQDVGREDAHPLVPMNPHKLYRTAFLREHGIRFIEGRRVLWEDIFFNIEVAAKAATISTLASVPFYHWVQTGGSGSTTFRRSDPAWWDHLERVLEAIVDRLGRDSLQGRQLRRHQYVSRILGSFTPGFLRRPEEERRLIEDRARRLQERFTDVSDDDDLDRGAAVVAAALRSGDSALLSLAASAAGTDRFGAPVLDRAEWRGGRLAVSATVTTVERLAGGGTFRIDGERVLAASEDLIEALAAELELDPAELAGRYDVAEELEATAAAFAVRGRGSRIGWSVESEVGARSRPASADGSEVSLRLTVDGAVDVRAAPSDPFLDDQVWDVFLRVDRVGRLQQPRIRSSIGAQGALVDGRPVVAYTNRDGFLSIDLGGGVASLFDGSTPSAVTGTTPSDGRTEVHLSLPEVATAGAGEGSGWVLLSFRRAGLRSAAVGLMRRIARREHPPARFRARFRPTDGDSAGGGVIATLELPGPGRYRWTASPRGTHMPAWSIRVDRTTARLEVAAHG
ncbi:glycosyltransferase [Agromyces salentinus]|uniref:Glycosyltransferase n=1 Tax=Agromyces salentinus TaxID=269421 RepID=A0ABN2MWB5_9MICO|nr:glycosyltransferase [Agromyces salentinus]